VTATRSTLSTATPPLASVAPRGLGDDARELAAGYAPHHRLYEIGGICGAIVATGCLAVRLAETPQILPLAPLAMVLGVLAADFISGFVHWACDTWGSTSTPIVGQLAIRTFREHHVDPTAIVRHDFVETNGHNFALSLIPSIAGLEVASPFARACLFATAVFVAMTSQIHKWAHEDAPPSFIRLLQRLRVILSTDHHDVHHAAPHTRNFCITTGWLDRPLHVARFFETLEGLVTALTGARVARDAPSAATTAPPPP